MKRILIIAGIGFWVIILLLVALALFFSMSSATAPGWLQWLPGVSGGDKNMVSINEEIKLLGEQSFSYGDYEKLEFRTSYQDITVNLTAGDDIVLRHYDFESAEAYTLTQNNGVLAVSAESNHFSIQIFNFGVFGDPPRFELDIPRGYAGDVGLHATSGTIQSESAPAWGNVDISASSGSLRWESGMECGVLQMKTTSGSIRLGDIKAASADLQSSSGGIGMGDLEARGAVSLKATSGSIRLGGIRCDTLTAQSSSGSLDFGGISAAGAVSLQTTSGGIRSGGINAASLRGKSSSATQAYGTIALNGQLELTSSSGSLKLNEGMTCEDFRLQSTSGSIRLGGENKGKGTIKSSSGSITVESYTITGDTDMNATSGSVKVTMARGQSYRFQGSTSSSSVRGVGIDLVYKSNNKEQAEATVGTDPTGVLTLHTSSGSVTLTDS